MIEIKNRWDGQVIYKSEKATLREAVIECIDLMQRLIAEKCAIWTPEQIVEFEARFKKPEGSK